MRFSATDRKKDSPFQGHLCFCKILFFTILKCVYIYIKPPFFENSVPGMTGISASHPGPNKLSWTIFVLSFFPTFLKKLIIPLIVIEGMPQPKLGYFRERTAAIPYAFNVPATGPIRIRRLEQHANRQTYKALPLALPATAGLRLVTKMVK